ncbi:hypothetical protein NDU88_005611 [Pleurodeles waltl]|uniref:Uncharacterized protein n=1 Tax=Pleurodeles waltl TaxID=8319 RepID=A0AAV7LLX9_PLEWA|nr:hypothetical protein NDU88_005611 [Pleurodeles waltl]
MTAAATPLAAFLAGRAAAAAPGRTKSNRPASSSKRSTWCTLASAAITLQKNRHLGHENSGRHHNKNPGYDAERTKQLPGPGPQGKDPREAGGPCRSSSPCHPSAPARGQRSSRQNPRPPEPGRSPADRWHAARSLRGSGGCGSPKRGPPRLFPSWIAPPPDGAQATRSPAPGLLDPGVPDHPLNPPAPEPPRPGLIGLLGGHSLRTSPGVPEGHNASRRGPGGLGRSPPAEFAREPAPRP